VEPFGKQGLDMKSKFFNDIGTQLPYHCSNWGLCDTEKRFLSSPIKEQWKDIEISYKYNNFGFRCNDFTQWQHSKFNVVFAGCSHTEGEGLPLEHTWAWLTYERIKSALNVDFPYWNIASGGTGLDTFVRYLWNYVPMLLPTYVIVMIPGFFRREPAPGRSWIPMENQKGNYSEVFSEEQFATYEYEKNICFISNIAQCYNFNVLAVYHQWELETYNFKIPHMKNIYSYVDNWPKGTNDKARDNLHVGTKTNEIYSNDIFNYFMKNLILID
jgi:hypothetical protein